MPVLEPWNIQPIALSLHQTDYRGCHLMHCIHPNVKHTLLFIQQLTETSSSPAQSRFKVAPSYYTRWTIKTDPSVSALCAFFTPLLAPAPSLTFYCITTTAQT